MNETITISTTRQSPTVGLDVETVRAAVDAGFRAEVMCGPGCMVAGACVGCVTDAVVAADPRRTEAEVKAEERERIVRAIAGSVPCGCELRHDGSEDPIAAAYVQALGDAARIAAGAPDA